MAKKTDANQKEIVALLRSIGATVLILSDVGKGCPDILIGIYGINLLAEIKNGENSPSQQKLTPREKWFFDTWRGQVAIIKSSDEALELIDSLNKK